MRGAEAHPQTGSRELLSRFKRRQGTDRDGGDGACALVRTTPGRVELRVVDRRSRRDPRQAGTEAEERPSGCRTFVAVASGEPISADLGAQSGESRSAAAALAPASAGADADTSQEPVAGHRPE